jgi:hypothetical protein
MWREKQISTLLRLILVLWLITSGNACRVTISTKMTSIPIQSNTVSIQYFQNRATVVNPTLSNTITEELKNKFLKDTRLDLVSRNGDLSFEGSIIDYGTDPVNIQSDDKAAQTRLTIKVKVKFTSVHKPELDYDQVFSRYRDYPSTMNLSAFEAGGEVEEIIEELIEDIFNKAVANW